jgi:hypothetical protein
MNASVGDKGVLLVLAAQCQRQIRDVWCSPKVVSCSTPPTVRKEVIACPDDLGFQHKQVWLRAPWQRDYEATSDATGTVEIPVDWASTGIDPMGDDAAQQLSIGWEVSFTGTGAWTPLSLKPEAIERMRAAIGAATDTQYEVGAANEKAALSMELGAEPAFVLGQSGTLSLKISNSGPQPAYRVIAKLRSSVEVFHGKQISFGRIDPGKSKVKTREIAIPPQLEDRSAVVAAEITYFNGDRLEVKKRFEIASSKPVEPPRGLALECKLVKAEVASGGRVPVECELRNASNEAVRGLTATVAVGDAVSKNLVPQSLAGAGPMKLELAGTVPATEKQGAMVPVVIRISAQKLPAVEKTLYVRVAQSATRCQKRLTRDEYKKKRKILQDALRAGNLTQQEFDKYDAENVSCLE